MHTLLGQHIPKKSNILCKINEFTLALQDSGKSSFRDKVIKTFSLSFPSVPTLVEKGGGKNICIYMMCPLLLFLSAAVSTERPEWRSAGGRPRDRAAAAAAGLRRAVAGVDRHLTAPAVPALPAALGPQPLSRPPRGQRLQSSRVFKSRALKRARRRQTKGGEQVEYMCRHGRSSRCSPTHPISRAKSSSA